MRYYKFEYGCDNKEVGSQYPQVWDFIKGYSPENEDNGVCSLYYDYNPLFPPVDPDLSGFKLASGAQYTDFLSTGFGNELFFLSENAKRLVEVTKECLEIGMAQIKPFYSQVRDIGIAIERYAKSKGYSVVMEYCGHGVGYKMHEDPYVLHYASYEPSVLLVPGMVITIEPMINEGSRYIRFKAGDDWTSYTKDGKLSAQWEHTIVITEDGYEVVSK